MWVLVIIALNANMIFTVPGYSTEETCSVGGQKLIATLAHAKHSVHWTHRCVETS
jgi:hypothetical protein